jgi:hypothetical protein
MIPRFLLLFFSPAVFLLGQTPVSSPTQWRDELRAFTEKILAIGVPARSVSLTVKSISALDAANASALEKGLQSEFAGRGLQIVSAGSAEMSIQVTLSQNTEGSLWIAQVHGGSVEGTIMLGPRATARAETNAAPVPALHETVLLAQPDPILDFASATRSDGGQFLLLLQNGVLLVLERDGSTWVRRDSAAIEHLHPWPRDLRGHVILSAANTVQIFLPGVSCSGRWSSKLTMECREEAPVAWAAGEQAILTLAPERNYFAASRLPARASNFEAPIWYSSAELAAGGAADWILTEADEKAELFQGGKGPVSSFGGWGDDIAALATGCGTERHVLATGSGDWGQPDRIQAYQIAGQQAVAAGQPLEFPGPVVALWPSDDSLSARVVFRNLQTGMYEASIISVACGN